MKTLGLDLAAHSGWCNLHKTDLHHSFEHGAFKIKPLFKGNKSRPMDHPGRQFWDMETTLWDLLQNHQPDRIAYETPAGQMNAMKNLYGYRSLLMYVAAEMSIPVLSIYPSTLKKFATGSGRADKAQMAEALEVKWSLKLDNDNTVDAVWLSLWGSQQSIT